MIGWIVPSINTTAEREAMAMLPSPAGLHIARAAVDTSQTLADQFRGMIEQLPVLASGLARADLEVVAFACTSAGFYQGPGSDSVITDTLEEAAATPAVTTATAVVDALARLDAHRVAVATPYVDWVRDAERGFLEGAGIEVTGIVGMGRRGGRDISGIGSDEVRQLVAEVDSPTADAILVSCTDLPAVHLVEELEARHGKPVVTSNQATMWACREVTGMDAVPGFGILLG